MLLKASFMMVTGTRNLRLLYGIIHKTWNGKQIYGMIFQAYIPSDGGLTTNYSNPLILVQFLNFRML